MRLPLSSDAYNVTPVILPPSWMGEGVDDTAAHRVGDKRHYNRNRLGGSFRGNSGGRGLDDDCIRTERNQLQSELVEGFKLISAKSVLDFEILSLDVDQLAKARLRCGIRASAR
jgi:hypothetical protein